MNKLDIQPKSINQISIVMAFSDGFTPSAAITIQSIIKVASDHRYVIYILHTSLTELNISKIKRLQNSSNKVDIEIYDVSQELLGIDFKMTDFAQKVVSKETFYRLLVPKLFNNFGKVLFLDSDLLIREDVYNLFSIDIGNNLIGACYDYVMLGIMSTEILNNYDDSSIEDSNIERLTVRRYMKTVLHLNDVYSYFQAGVLLFNIEEFRKTFKDDELITMASTTLFRTVDQDLLNAVCQNRVFFLPAEWNVLPWGYDNVKNIPHNNLRESYVMSLINPKIVHYAGIDYKPWRNVSFPFADEFWQVARQSPFYEILLARMVEYKNDELRQKLNSVTLKSLLKQAIKNRLRKFVGFFAPIGTRRRTLLKKIWGKTRGHRR